MLLNSAFTIIKEKENFDYLSRAYAEMLRKATKDKKNVFKSLMIGILNFAKDSAYSGLNHFYVYPVEDNYFS